MAVAEEEEHAFLSSTPPRISRSLEVERRDEDPPFLPPVKKSRLLWASLLVLAAISAGGIALLFRASGIGFHSAAAPAQDGSKAAMGLGFHFRAPPNSSVWMMDPNAPVFYRGFYHLFYRFVTPAKNQSSWGHAVSKNLLHWTHLSTALEPGPERYDELGILGGSMTLLLGQKSPVILYTGISSDGTTTQNAAVPADPADAMLKNWKKIAKNPLIPAPPGIAMRDPSSAWRDSSSSREQWRILLGGENASDGVGFVYWSEDFLRGEWKRSVTPLLRMPGAGILECPDFFPVSGSKHVVKASLRSDPAATFGSDSYAVGRYFPDNGSFVPDDVAGRTLGLRYDHGNSFFASKSFADAAKDRRVLWALLPDDLAMAGAPVQSIPRKLWLGSDDEEEVLLQLPVDEVKSLRIGPGIHKAGLTLEPGAVIQAGDAEEALSQLDVELVFELPDLTTQMSMENFDVEFSSTGNAAAHCRKKGARVNGILGPFGVLVLATGDLVEHTAIFFHLGRSRKGPVALVCADHSRSSLANHPVSSEEDPATAAALHGAFVHLEDPSVFRMVAKEEVEVLELRILVDNSVVETFAQRGKISITSRVYPTLAKGHAARLFLFNNGTSAVRLKRLDAWKMKAAAATFL